MASSRYRLLCQRNEQTQSRCPVTESPSRSLPRRLYFDTDSPPEDLFQNRFAPGDYILKQSLRGERLFHPPSQKKPPRGGGFFLRGMVLLKFHFIKKKKIY